MTGLQPIPPSSWARSSSGMRSLVKGRKLNTQCLKIYHIPFCFLKCVLRHGKKSHWWMDLKTGTFFSTLLMTFLYHTYSHIIHGNEVKCTTEDHFYSLIYTGFPITSIKFPLWDPLPLRTSYPKKHLSLLYYEQGKGCKGSGLLILPFTLWSLGWVMPSSWASASTSEKQIVANSASLQEVTCKWVRLDLLEVWLFNGYRGHNLDIHSNYPPFHLHHCIGLHAFPSTPFPWVI